MRFSLATLRARTLTPLLTSTQPTTSFSTPLFFSPRFIHSNSRPISQKKDGNRPPRAPPTKSIFVGLLPWHVDKDMLAKEFSSCGQVISAYVSADRKNGKSKGYGYVHFSNSDAVEKALRRNGVMFHGKAIRVDREYNKKPLGQQQTSPSTTLYMGNLAFHVTEDTVWAVFGEWRVKSVKLPMDRDLRGHRGFAYVEFETLKDAQAAFDAKKTGEIDGRPLLLDFARSSR